MESKGKELLPKIQSVITALRQTKPPPNDTTDHLPGATKATKPKTGSDTATTASSKSGVEFDLSLPIDLPGLVSTHTTITPKKSTPSDAKVNRVKPKQGESSSKEVRSGSGGGTKVKTNEGKADSTTAPRDVRMKEERKDKADKAPSAVPVDEAAGCREDKKALKVKKSKEETKEKTAPENSKEAKVGGGADETKEAKMKSKADSPSTAKEPEEQAEAPGSKKWGGGGAEGREKQLPTRRRSARIASLTEDPRKNDDSDHEDDTKDHRPKRRPSGDASEADTLTQTGRRKALSGKTSSRKRTRGVWESSSSGESDDETEHTGRNKRSKMDTANSRKQSSKHTPELQDSPTPVRRSRQCSKTGSGSPASSQAEAVEKMDQDQPPPLIISSSSSSSRRKSKQPQRVVSRSSRSPLKSPPTPVVTRFNRHVKPNRKYYDSEQEEEEGGGSAESGDSDDDDSRNNEAYREEETNSCHSDDETMSEQNDNV